MEINNNYNINFGAKLGPNLKTTLLKKEFGGDKSRLKKFEDVFEKTFNECLEENTVLEMTAKEEKVLSEVHDFLFQEIKFPELHDFFFQEINIFNWFKKKDK